LFHRVKHLLKPSKAPERMVFKTRFFLCTIGRKCSHLQMPFHAYPFVVIRPGDIARPYLPAKISNPDANKSINVYALIDTGADECALPASFASILGHRLEAGKEKKISTGNGITIAFGHSSVIEIPGFSTGPVNIDYMPQLSTPLLDIRAF